MEAKCLVREVCQFPPYRVKVQNVRKYFYLKINQLDALNFIVSLFYASICFEHTFPSSGGQEAVPCTGARDGHL